MVKKTKHEAPDCVIFSILLSSWYSPQQPVPKHNLRIYFHSRNESYNPSKWPVNITGITNETTNDRSMAQAVSLGSPTVRARVQSQARPRVICDAYSSTGTDVPPYLGSAMSVSFHQFTILIHLSPTLYGLVKVSNKSYFCTLVD